MMVKHIGFTRAMMEEKEDHPVRETHQEQWQAMTDGLRRAQKRLENWYRSHNPLYPECDCPIFPLLTDPWEGERALLADPALRAIDHQMPATSLALGVFQRHRRFYEESGIALPIDVANFFNLPYERRDPTADCPAASN